MSEQVKAAIIVAAAIIGAVAIWVYFSPYQTCIRGLGGDDAEYVCAIATRAGGR